MKEDINNNSSNLENNELKNRIEKLKKEKIDELKKEKRKYNFKKALITLRYTLPTISYLALALGSCSFFYKYGSVKYEHTLKEFKSGSEPKVNEFYNENKKEYANLVFKGIPYVNPDGNSYSRVVYTYNLDKIDINNFEDWLQNTDYSDIQNFLKLLPQPNVNIENCDSKYFDEAENYEVLINIDQVSKTIYVKDFDKCITAALYFIALYVWRQFSTRNSYNEKETYKIKFFPESLIKALKNLEYSDEANDIKELEKEIDGLVLTLSKM
ncbi:MAG: hypothetical protein IJB83_01770 [Bacilli bacterium]|nr:hypothetical protein [Bacilli bacterium]